MLIGISEDFLREFLGGDYRLFIDFIVRGEIKGIVVIVGCLNFIFFGYDVFIVEFIKELIKRDIFVFFVGCISGGFENCGFMLKGVEKMVGEKFRKVCEKLNIFFVLNFGFCFVIGRFEMVVVEFV